MGASILALNLFMELPTAPTKRLVKPDDSILAMRMSANSQIMKSKMIENSAVNKASTTVISKDLTDHCVESHVSSLSNFSLVLTFC